MEFKVSLIVRPGAPVEPIVNDLGERSRDICANDVVIIMGEEMT